MAPDDDRARSTFNVTSHNQQGGLTAGKVTIGRPPRILDSTLKKHLLEILPGRDEQVTVESALGDSEARDFAQQICDFLRAENFNVHGVNLVVKTQPVRGQTYYKGNNTISIGSVP